MNPSSPGQIIPYNGDVVWAYHGSAEALWIQADYWQLKGSGGFGITIKQTAGGQGVQISSLSTGHIAIGPGVTFEATGNAGSAIRFASFVWDEEDIVIDGVTFGTGPGSFYGCVAFSQTNKALPSSSDYRLVVKNSKFANFRAFAVYVTDSWGLLFESNYVLFNRPGTTGVSLISSSYGKCQNNVFEVASASFDYFFYFGCSGRGNGYQSLQNKVRANTFICGGILPRFGAFYFYDSHSSLRSPKQNHFTNLLFDGSCANTGVSSLLSGSLRTNLVRGEDTDVFRVKGTGVFGTVYEWTRGEGKGVFALKVMSPGADPEQFKKTIEGYQKAKHLETVVRCVEGRLKTRFPCSCEAAGPNIEHPQDLPESDSRGHVQEKAEGSRISDIIILVCPTLSRTEVTNDTASSS